MDLSQTNRLLARMSSGDSEAANELYPILYEELRAVARRSMSGQHDAHTLQPTALIHEAFLKLSRSQGRDWDGRGHFLACAASAMRSILIDHARAKASSKRSSEGERVRLHEGLRWEESQLDELLQLEEALQKLERAYPRMAKIVELRFFAGLTVVETAEVLEVSKPTLLRDWRFARAWLYGQLGQDDASEADHGA